MLLGHARGKVGDLVFSRSNGQQVTRARAAVVKNPQTESQMVQRIILNTVSQAYSRMQAIVDHSFEGVPAGQKTMSVFLKQNMDALRQRIGDEIASGGEFANVYAFAPIGSKDFAPNAFIISAGSLPSVATVQQSGTSARIGLTANTYQAVINDYGLQRGDQLTFVAVKGADPATMTFHYARVILDPTDADGSALPLSTAFVADGAINAPSVRNEGSFTSLSQTGSRLEWILGPAAQLMDAAAVIVSRKNSDGSYMRSNTQMTVFDGAELRGASMQDALDLFANSGFDTLNSRYLNNAGSGRVASVGVSNTQVFTTKAGTQVTAVGIQQNADSVVFKDADGASYYIQCGDRFVAPYEKFLKATTGNQSTAWGTLAEGVSSDANTVLIDFSNSTGTDATPEVKWLISQGVSYTVFFLA